MCSQRRCLSTVKLPFFFLYVDPLKYFQFCELKAYESNWYEIVGNGETGYLFEDVFDKKIKSENLVLSSPVSFLKNSVLET